MMGHRYAVCALDITPNFLPKLLRTKALANLFTIQVQQRKGRGSPR